MKIGDIGYVLTMNFIEPVKILGEWIAPDNIEYWDVHYEKTYGNGYQLKTEVFSTEEEVKEFMKLHIGNEVKHLKEIYNSKEKLMKAMYYSLTENGYYFNEEHQCVRDLIKEYFEIEV
jgi:hypothetical protein